MKSFRKFLSKEVKLVCFQNFGTVTKEWNVIRLSGRKKSLELVAVFTRLSTYVTERELGPRIEWKRTVSSDSELLSLRHVWDNQEEVLRG